MTELFVEIVDPLASSGGSNSNPHSANIVGPSRPAIQQDTEKHQVVSPSFGFNLQGEVVDCGGDLGEFRSFGELAVEIAASPRLLFTPVVERVPEPLIEEALRLDDSNDDPTQQRGLFGVGRREGESNSGTQGSQGSSTQVEFKVGQTFMSKEVVVLAVNNYSIRREVEYKVIESDHTKYLGRCKVFGEGLIG
ncbi:hypothetical protein PIB30_027160 [Stylosanthes scabra]|uniref:Transposase MuDR plant domain-containing protein n=1 Tax=Stylosanthes scabra TaxID=79078 RepID=A0ABU6Z892_9FABA|nr:hypothetical protein [Stylosanthes scabra]